MNDKLTAADLNDVVNTWSAGTIGAHQESAIIAQLDAIGSQIGYGALAQLAEVIRDIQCYGNVAKWAMCKKSRFELLEWQLPPRFDERFISEYADENCESVAPAPVGTHETNDITTAWRASIQEE